MKQIRRIILTEKLTEDRLSELLNEKMGRFYLGYLSIIFKDNNSNLVKSNIKLINEFIK